ncbi:MAG TPA: poly-gamma-glutamate hydrolase family protein [Methylibium sp.]|uniref:poly-gamma-glutamate hydrolase family protein n=1 Tax=Methylibium sp. TaxID=2067992 RepID=UPI002DC02EEF|nr:poly-gamma-glutamate hydrolase family protein [Methylibium sp.]HEU4458966.1 poly-gamma-glutamate hydrolase family protein [Methylibium sp.]
MAEPRSFADIAARFRRGSDYEILVRPLHASTVAIVAPHGGGIERATSAVARAIAGEDFNLYLFEGRLTADNHARLHLTSHRFDEPEALALVARCDRIVTIHGYNAQPVEPDPGVIVGGLDDALKAELAGALREAGIEAVTDGLRFQALDPHNICNRGRRRIGVQLELSGRLRGGPLQPSLVAAVRGVLGR